MKDDLCKLNLVLNSFSVSPIYVSWLFEVVSVIVALYTTHLVRHLPLRGQEFFFFADSYIVCYLELILSFCAVVVSDSHCLFIVFLLKICLSFCIHFFRSSMYGGGGGGLLH